MCRRDAGQRHVLAVHVTAKAALQLERGAPEIGHAHQVRGPALMQHRQSEILWAEVMSPLRHAMRFVQREKSQRNALQQFQKAGRHQPFRRDV